MVDDEDLDFATWMRGAEYTHLKSVVKKLRSHLDTTALNNFAALDRAPPHITQIHTQHS
jgi:hypothetical protein